MAGSNKFPPIPISYDPSRETIRDFHESGQVTATDFAVLENDWTSYQFELKGEVAAKGENRFKREVFHHSQGADTSEYDQGKRTFKKHHVSERAKLLDEQERMDEAGFQGSSNVIHMAAVGKFTANAGKKEENYLVSSVTHSGDFPEAFEGIQISDQNSKKGKAVDGYRNSFKCRPKELALRIPRRLHSEKPQVYGVHLATVIGPKSEEVETDEYGRVLIQFHWDREAADVNPHRCCWVRVAQAWAGLNVGTVFIPRIGMEVLVQFLEGDPDRPIIIGCVYNSKNIPPLDLPKEKTKSTIRTKTSPGNKGGVSGYNELKFEDKKGSEEISIHAQKDMNETVENNHSTTVHADQTNTVNGNHAESVKKKQTLSVDGSRSVHVKGSQSVTIDGSAAEDGVTGGKLNITGDYKLDASKTIEEQAPNHIKLTCGDSFIKMEPGKITIHAGGNAEMVLDANALVKSSAGSQVKLDGNAGMSTGGEAKVEGGPKTDVTAQTVTLQGAAGSVEAAASGVTAAGPQINVNGSAGVNISAALVKIN